MTQILDQFTGILAVSLSLLMCIIIPVVAIWTGHQRRLREAEIRHREHLAAIEKGLPIAPEQVAAAKRSGSPLLRGLIWLGVGLALVFCRLDSDLSKLGWIPVAVGAAYLIFYAVEARKHSA
jgi:hypothetical protein